MGFKEKRILEQISIAMKNRRVALKLSQRAAAEKADVKTPTLIKFEKTGLISLSSLVKLMIAYKMDTKILNSFKDRSDWTLEQIERAETKKKIRPETKKETGIWIQPIMDAKFGLFTPGKWYKTLYREGETYTAMENNKSEVGRSFIIKDDNGKEVLIAQKYCKDIKENK